MTSYGDIPHLLHDARLTDVEWLPEPHACRQFIAFLPLAPQPKFIEMHNPVSIG
jgi:hypothetical protein